jgi:hypothetical protein
VSIEIGAALVAIFSMSSIRRFSKYRRCDTGAELTGVPNHAYPDAKERGRAVAMWAGGVSLALTAGPFVGGARELLRISELLAA